MWKSLVVPLEYRNYGMRIIELFLGCVFFFSAISKVFEINRFCVQIYAYGVITQKELLPIIAILMILIEITLSYLFILNFPFRKLTIGITIFLLLSFTFLIGYGWYFNNLKDCGCFGKIEMGPGPSILKNIVLITMAGSCLWGVKEKMINREKNNFGRKYLLPLLAIWAITLTLSIGKLREEDKLISSVNNTISKSPYANLSVEIDGEIYDLSKGEYLVALFSFGCEHCIEQAPKVNEYLLFPQIPPVIALCLEESSKDREEFITKVQPNFKIYSLGDKVRLFFSLIGKEPPRLVYLKDGEVIKIWDYELPTSLDLLHELEEHKIRNSK